MGKADWVWMPHAGHFIAARDCSFIMNTRVPGRAGGAGYIVSTVGEYLPAEAERERIAKARGVILEGKDFERIGEYMFKIGFDEVGSNRLFETLVFPATRSGITDPAFQCCLWVSSDWDALEMVGYKTATEAYNGHIALCEKWDGA